MKTRKRISVSLLGCIIILTLIPIACSSGGDIQNPPPFASPDKGNPKLDSQLNQLVGAEKRGELNAFAKQTKVELFNGDVRVIIECLPGQLETASAAAVSAGAKLEMSYSNMVQAKVPVASLSALADAESVRLIRLPQQPLPASNK